MSEQADSNFVLDDELIKIHMKAESRDDIFQQLGDNLIKKGYVKSNYVQALKDREKEYPTGLQTSSMGIAVPHTDASYVNKPTISVAVLDKNVKFELMGSDDGTVNVGIVFMLVFNNPDKHLSVLQKLMNIIQKEDLLKSLKNASDVSTVKQILEKELN